ncbi:MAG: hypothetical protein QM820_59105 [Minicystis sp.]
MTIDLNAFPPEVKLRQIADGEQFSSDETFDQATQTLQGLDKYGDKLKPFGLPLSDGARLRDAQELLSAAGFGRHQARSKKKTLSVALDDAEKTARTVRLRGRSVLESAWRKLLEQGQTTAANAASATLDATASSEKTGEDLAKQLDALASALDPATAPEAAAAAVDGGGPEALPKLKDAATVLRAAVKNKPGLRGTPEETQRLDQNRRDHRRHLPPRAHRGGGGVQGSGRPGDLEGVQARQAVSAGRQEGWEDRRAERQGRPGREGQREDRRRARRAGQGDAVSDHALPSSAAAHLSA